MPHAIHAGPTCPKAPHKANFKIFRARRGFCRQNLAPCSMEQCTPCHGFSCSELSYDLSENGVHTKKMWLIIIYAVQNHAFWVPWLGTAAKVSCPSTDPMFWSYASRISDRATANSKDATASSRRE